MGAILQIYQEVLGIPLDTPQNPQSELTSLSRSPKPINNLPKKIYNNPEEFTKALNAIKEEITDYFLNMIKNVRYNIKNLESFKKDLLSVGYSNLLDLLEGHMIASRKVINLLFKYTNMYKSISDYLNGSLSWSSGPLVVEALTSLLQNTRDLLKSYNKSLKNINKIYNLYIPIAALYGYIQRVLPDYEEYYNNPSKKIKLANIINRRSDRKYVSHKYVSHLIMNFFNVLRDDKKRKILRDIFYKIANGKEIYIRDIKQKEIKKVIYLMRIAGILERKYDIKKEIREDGKVVVKPHVYYKAVSRIRANGGKFFDSTLFEVFTRMSQESDRALNFLRNFVGTIISVVKSYEKRTDKLDNLLKEVEEEMINFDNLMRRKNN